MLEPFEGNAFIEVTENFVKRLLALPLIAVFLSTPAIAETRGEAFLRDVWQNLPADSDYQLMARYSPNAAATALLEQGIDWCGWADVPDGEVILAEAMTRALSPDANADSDVIVPYLTMYAAYNYLCPEFYETFQRAGYILESDTPLDQ